MTADSEISEKVKQLERLIQGVDSLAVAFSGGVDSTFLLAVAKTILGDNVIAVTAESDIHPEWEKQGAYEIAQKLDAEHLVFSSHELNLPDFLSNSRNRCYVCKKALFKIVKGIVFKKGISSIAHGANMDDLRDFRPGIKAAEEDGILSPLIDAFLTKNEIRLLSRRMGLPNWNKPPMACLATRIPYGNPITRNVLHRIEKAEQFMLDAGFSLCRVRFYGSMVRIEVDHSEVKRLLEDFSKLRVVEFFKSIGFLEISVDLEGYRQGNMNNAERKIQELSLSEPFDE